MRLSWLLLISLVVPTFGQSTPNEARPRSQDGSPGTQPASAAFREAVAELERRAAALMQKKSTIEAEVNRDPALVKYLETWNKTQAELDAVKGDQTKGAEQRIKAMNSLTDAKIALERRRAALLRERNYGPLQLAIRDTERLLEQAKQEMHRASETEMEEAARKLAAQQRLSKVPVYLRSRNWANAAEVVPLESVPLQGDEIPILLFKQQYKSYVETAGVVCVSIVSTDSYEGTYSNAKQSHYAFMIYPVDAKAQIGRSEYAYLLRALGDDLLNYAVRNEVRGTKAARVVRLRIVVDKAQGRVVDKALPEIVDWQFLNEDRRTWGPWYSEVDPVGIDLVRQIYQLHHDHSGMMAFYQRKQIENLEKYRSGEISASVADGLATYMMDGANQEEAKYKAEKQRMEAELVNYRERNGLDLVKKALRNEG